MYDWFATTGQRTIAVGKAQQQVCPPHAANENNERLWCTNCLQCKSACSPKALGGELMLALDEQMFGKLQAYEKHVEVQKFNDMAVRFNPFSVRRWRKEIHQRPFIAGCLHNLHECGNGNPWRQKGTHEKQTTVNSATIQKPNGDSELQSLSTPIYCAVEVPGT